MPVVVSLLGPLQLRNCHGEHTAAEPEGFLALDGEGWGGEVGCLGPEFQALALLEPALLIEEASCESSLWCQLIHLYESLLSIMAYSVIYIMTCSIKQHIE